jgi:hypothetical protein
MSNTRSYKGAYNDFCIVHVRGENTLSCDDVNSHSELLPFGAKTQGRHFSSAFSQSRTAIAHGLRGRGLRDTSLVKLSFNGLPTSKLRLLQLPTTGELFIFRELRYLCVMAVICRELDQQSLNSSIPNSALHSLREKQGAH